MMYTNRIFSLFQLAFGLTQAFNMEKGLGLGLMTIGCSPGGGASNMWTHLLHGDLNLSMTMTFISTLLSLGKSIKHVKKLPMTWKGGGGVLLSLKITGIVNFLRQFASTDK